MLLQWCCGNSIGLGELVFPRTGNTLFPFMLIQRLRSVIRYESPCSFATCSNQPFIVRGTFLSLPAPLRWPMHRFSIETWIPGPETVFQPCQFADRISASSVLMLHLLTILPAVWAPLYHISHRRRGATTKVTLCLIMGSTPLWAQHRCLQATSSIRLDSI